MSDAFADGSKAVDPQGMFFPQKSLAGNCDSPHRLKDTGLSCFEVTWRLEGTSSAVGWP